MAVRDDVFGPPRIGGDGVSRLSIGLTCSVPYHVNFTPSTDYQASLQAHTSCSILFYLLRAECIQDKKSLSLASEAGMSIITW